MKQSTEKFYRKVELHRKIVARLNYNPYQDFISGLILSSLIKEDNWPLIPKREEVNVIGPWHYSGEPDGYNIVADSALKNFKGRADMIVSDLDGPIEKIIQNENAIKVIHAHGDNIDKMIEFVPLIKGIVLGTTQSIPFEPVKNIGGFTDGDRAIIMGKIMGAKIVKVYGFNWDDPVDEPREIKRRKMLIGKEIIEKLTNIKIVYVNEE
ncbi:MAG: hypothetical protein ACP5RG_05460 [Thermoplasmata archaeon]